MADLARKAAVQYVIACFLAAQTCEHVLVYWGRGKELKASNTTNVLPFRVVSNVLHLPLVY